jgi:hypothetical protein
LFSPIGFPTTTEGDYYYRFYPATNAYLGISVIDNHVYYFGTDAKMQDKGNLSNWLAAAGCQ